MIRALEEGNAHPVSRVVVAVRSFGMNSHERILRIDEPGTDVDTTREFRVQAGRGLVPR